jgi:3-dehydroquinate synthetase
LSRIGLPEKIEGVTLTQILKTMRHDKKFVGNKNRFVLAARVGSVKVVDHVPLDTIKAAIKRFLV